MNFELLTIEVVRALYIVSAVLFSLTLGGLSNQETARQGNIYGMSALLIAIVATAYYFLHFLVILPVLGFKEKTIPVPLSITESVLGGSPNLAAARNRESSEKLK